LLEGSAKFDSDSEFPYFALFLDDAHALLLKSKRYSNLFIRVGGAWFHLTNNESRTTVNVRFKADMVRIEPEIEKALDFHRLNLSDERSAPLIADGNMQVVTIE
jgi:hypothetical protein